MVFKRKDGPRIVATPRVCDGRPRVVGTKVTVLALTSAARIMGIVEIQAKYPDLAASDIVAALAYAKANPDAIAPKPPGRKAALDPAAVRERTVSFRIREGSYPVLKQAAKDYSGLSVAAFCRQVIWEKINPANRR